ncbi:MAG TPA: GtrA family protein, partial [Croceibacterium sp.]|nr:GtrA family protein [Croceibacterium sp.]
MSLTLRYVAFAVLATAGNLATQRLVMGLVDPQLAFHTALFAGTLVGLVIKYALDKRWIFADPAQGLAAHGRRFSLYTLMGVVTTAIFWGTETAFWLTWHTQGAREIGAILGLSVGYVAKYQLDRRYVFSASGAA